MAILCIPIILIPGIIGIMLLFRNPGEDLTRMAALLTLKPYLTTPIWMFLLALGGSNDVSIMALVAILPGALLSLWTYSAYEHLITGNAATSGSKLLFGLDCARWINSLFLGFTLVSSRPGYPQPTGILGVLSAVSVFLGMALPFIYPVVAWVIVARAQEKSKGKPKGKNDDFDEIVKI